MYSVAAISYNDCFILFTKTSGQNEEITCSKAEQQEIQTEEKRTDLTIESGKENKSDKPAREKKRKPKKDQVSYIQIQSIISLKVCFENLHARFNFLQTHLALPCLATTQEHKYSNQAIRVYSFFVRLQKTSNLT